MDAALGVVLSFCVVLCALRSRVSFGVGVCDRFSWDMFCKGSGAKSIGWLVESGYLIATFLLCSSD